jgi:ATP-dependent helicase HrpA
MAATRSELVGEGALIRNPWDWFSHYPRYAKAMAVRAERLAANYARDQQLQQQVCEFEARYRDLVKSGEISPEISFSLQRYRLMLQEFRVSLFAQQLGTSQAVSAKRLEAQWERVQRWIDESGGRTPEKV